MDISPHIRMRPLFVPPPAPLHRCPMPVPSSCPPPDILAQLGVTRLLEFPVECCQVSVVRVADESSLDVNLSLKQLRQTHASLSTPASAKHPHNKGMSTAVVEGIIGEASLHGAVVSSSDRPICA